MDLVALLSPVPTTRTSRNAGPGLRLAGRSRRQAERGPLPRLSHGRAGGGGGDHRHLAHRRDHPRGFWHHSGGAGLVVSAGDGAANLK